MADNLPKTVLIHEKLTSGLLTKANVTHASQHHWDGSDPLTAVDVYAEPSLGTVGSAGTYGVEETVLGVHGLKALVEADITDLQDYALDNAVVHLTGKETVAGEKTFEDNFVVEGNIDCETFSINSYERHIQLSARANGTPADTPTYVTIGTASALQYPTTESKYAYCQWEVPDDWDGNAIYFEVNWNPDSGAMANPDAVKWIVNYRSIAEGETLTNGTAGSVTHTYNTATLGGLSQYQTYHSRVTLNDANQPLTKQDHVYFQITRDTSVANDFGGTVGVMAYEIIYGSTSLPRG